MTSSPCWIVIPIAMAFATVQSGTPDTIPAGWLHGDTLTVVHRNFSVVSPPGWTWTRSAVSARGMTGEAFVATSPGAETIAGVMAFDMQLWKFNDAAQGLVKGILKSLPEGWEADDFVTTWTNTPSPNTLKYRVRLKSPENDILYQFSYLIPGRISYMLTTTGLTEVEPSSFEGIVSSFRVLNVSRNVVHIPAALAIARPRTLLVVLLGFLMLTELFVRFGLQSTPPPFTFVSRLLVVIGVAGALFFTQIDIRPEDAGSPGPYAAGAVLGTLSIAAVAAYLAYGRPARRNWNKFARLFCLLAIVLPVLSAAGRINK